MQLRLTHLVQSEVVHDALGLLGHAKNVGALGRINVTDVWRQHMVLGHNGHALIVVRPRRHDKGLEERGSRRDASRQERRNLSSSGNSGGSRGSTSGFTVPLLWNLLLAV